MVFVSKLMRSKDWLEILKLLELELNWNWVQQPYSTNIGLFSAGMIGVLVAEPDTLSDIVKRMIINELTKAAVGDRWRGCAATWRGRWDPHCWMRRWKRGEPRSWPSPSSCSSSPIRVSLWPATWRTSASFWNRWRYRRRPIETGVWIPWNGRIPQESRQNDQKIPLKWPKDPTNMTKRSNQNNQKIPLKWPKDPTRTTKTSH